MTEKFSFGWESNHTPLAFRARALTAGPPMPPVIVLPSKGLVLLTNAAAILRGGTPQAT